MVAHFKVISLLAIRSNNLGKGLGTKLTKSCSDFADEVGLPIFLVVFPVLMRYTLTLDKDVRQFELAVGNYWKMLPILDQ